MSQENLFIKPPRSLAVRTAYKHHGATSGYRQLLKHTNPEFVVGKNERNKSFSPLPVVLSYKWLYEWLAWIKSFSINIDVIHILYGEEYFRFADRLFPNTPIVVTFHQPPDILEREITKGDVMGRAYAVTHRLNPSRFRRLAAAIVLTESQREVLAKVMDPNKIHVIPLGCDAEGLISQSKSVPRKIQSDTILTVGNWLRDWDFYFGFVEYCYQTRANWKFVLINRHLHEKWRKRAVSLPNLVYRKDVTDGELVKAYVNSSAQFLPLLAATGNNSLNEALACGCPIVSNHSIPLANAQCYSSFVDLKNCEVATAIEKWINQPSIERNNAINAAQKALRTLDWSVVARQTILIYNKVINGN